MKLLIVTCLKEYQDDVIKIFKKADIHAFSATQVIGYKDNNPPDLIENWFASGDELFDSLMIFSITAAENAEHGMNGIKIFNKETKTNFPVRVFIVPVERSSI